MEKDSDLEILIPCLILLVLVLILLWYFFRSGFPERLISREFPFDLTEPLLGVIKFSWTRQRRDLLFKRCDQSSTNEVENRIIARLKQDSAINIAESVWDRALDDGQRPVIVFCVISSRIGTDIENAIRGVHDNSPIVLVLLHCVLSSLLRGDLSDDEELLDTTLRRRMTGITHFAFSDREGLYDCHQNRVGLSKLVDVVNYLPEDEL